MDENYDENYTFILRRPEVANFADTIKIAVMLIRTTLRDSVKVKKWGKIYYNKFLSGFSNITKIANLWWKNFDVSRTPGVCHMLYTFFGSSLGKV